MKSRKLLVNIVILLGISLLITIAAYFFNTWLLSLHAGGLLVEDRSPTDMFFVEGMLSAIVGLLLLLGIGINLWSQRAVLISARPRAVHGEDTVHPVEIFRRGMRIPKGFIRIALILVLAGAFMILIYFLTL